MNQKQGNSINKKKIAASIIAVSAIAATGYEVNRLSADPIGEKDCPPILQIPPFQTICKSMCRLHLYRRAIF